MDIVRPTTTTALRILVDMIQYYRGMWPKWSHILDPLTEADSGPKGIKKLLIMY